MKKIPLVITPALIISNNPCAQGLENFMGHVPDSYLNLQLPISLISILNVSPVEDVYWSLHCCSQEQQTQLIEVLPQMLGDIFTAFSELYQQDRKDCVLRAAASFYANAEDFSLRPVPFDDEFYEDALVAARGCLFEKGNSHRYKLTLLSRCVNELCDCYQRVIMYKVGVLERKFSNILKKYVCEYPDVYQMVKLVPENCD